METKSVKIGYMTHYQPRQGQKSPGKFNATESKVKYVKP